MSITRAGATIRRTRRPPRAQLLGGRQKMGKGVRAAAGTRARAGGRGQRAEEMRC